MYNKPRGKEMNRKTVIAVAAVLLLAFVGTISAVAQSDRDRDNAGFFPVVVSFVPGISFPFGGTYSTNFGFGMLMSDVHNLYGVQTSSIIGTASGNVLGVQANGIGTVTQGRTTGFQASGVFNVAEDRVVGGQFGGVFNVAQGNVVGVQSGGVFNVAEGDVFFLQNAGVFNVAEGTVRGAQVGGVFNVAGDVTGAQVAGVFNVAEKVKGVQIGLVNVSDEMYGVPIGLINIVREGISTPAVWFDEGGRSWASLQRGSNLFYGLVYAGGDPDEIFTNSPIFIGGAGGGIRLGGKPDRRLFLDMDVSVKTEIDAAKFGTDVATWNLTAVPSLRGTLGFRLFGRFSLIGGAYADLRFNPESSQQVLFQSNAISASIDLAGAELYPTLFLGLARK
jgi:hypothetical protein